MGNMMSLAVSVGVPLVGGMAIGIGLRDEVKTWYPTLKKPSWNPPNWIFGPMWTLLYAAMGVASHRVWAAGGGPVPLTLYGVQLAMNMAWSPLFFGVHNLKAATIDITALIGVLGATIVEFNKVDPTAAALLLPYLGWTSFAAALTWNIFLNNSADGKKTKAAASRAGDEVMGVASEATSKAAAPFLAQGGEKQGAVVPGTTKEE